MQLRNRYYDSSPPTTSVVELIKEQMREQVNARAEEKIMYYEDKNNKTKLTREQLEFNTKMVTFISQILEHSTSSLDDKLDVLLVFKNMYEYLINSQDFLSQQGKLYANFVKTTYYQTDYIEEKILRIGKQVSDMRTTRNTAKLINKIKNEVANTTHVMFKWCEFYETFYM